MNKLQIAFYGTPDFAVSILEALINSKYSIAAVITAPDKPAGRGRKLKPSAVKQFALQHELTVLQPTNLKSPDFEQELKKLQINLQIVVAFRMLPKVVWQLPNYGTFNLHASLLPQFRGAAPIHWAIIKGETQTGLTTFFIDEKIDTGAIIKTVKVEITPIDTFESLYQKLIQKGPQLVLETLKLIENDSVETVSQKTASEVKMAPKLTKENTKINWNLPLQELQNLIRGLNPYPASWCYLNQNKEQLTVKIYDTESIIETHSFPTGTVVTRPKELLIATKEGFVKILKMQLPNKRAMYIKDIINGYTFEKDAYVS